MVKPKGLSKQSNKSGAGRDGAERRILAAARREFVAKGLDGARMQAIATGAGVNKALVHYYFRSKDRLYRTVVLDTLETVWSALQESLRTHPEAGGLEGLVRTLVTTYLHTLARNPDFPLFMFREMAGGGAAFQAALKEAGAPFGDIPARLLAAYREEAAAGRVKPVSPLHFLVNVMGMSVATFLARPVIEKLGPALGSPVTFDAAFLDQRAESIVDTVMNGVRARKGKG